MMTNRVKIIFKINFNLSKSRHSAFHRNGRVIFQSIHKISSNKKNYFDF